MTKPWQALEWDSAFFGMPVARIQPGTRAAELPEALSGLRAGGFGLAYWILDRPDAARGQAALT